MNINTESNEISKPTIGKYIVSIPSTCLRMVIDHNIIQAEPNITNIGWHYNGLGCKTLS